VRPWPSSTPASTTPIPTGGGFGAATRWSTGTIRERRRRPRGRQRPRHPRRGIVAGEAPAPASRRRPSSPRTRCSTRPATATSRRSSPAWKRQWLRQSAPRRVVNMSLSGPSTVTIRSSRQRERHPRRGCRGGGRGNDGPGESTVGSPARHRRAGRRRQHQRHRRPDDLGDGAGPARARRADGLTVGDPPPHRATSISSTRQRAAVRLRRGDAEGKAVLISYNTSSSRRCC